MSAPDPRFFEAPGEIIPPGDLRIPKARSFALLLAEVGDEAFASLRETRRLTDAKAEIVVLEVQVERPQRLANDIRRTEMIAAIFREADENFPEVLALRSDFPSVPHLVLDEQEFPRRLCLYEQPYENERLNWTPARFLKRIRYWLAKTATGMLHAEDQPLEPLILGSRIRLIVPSDLAYSELEKAPGLLDIYRIPRATDADLTLVAYWRQKKASEEVHAVAAVFSCQPQAHGVIRRQPTSLGELHAICAAAGLDLAAQLATKIREWHVQKPAASVLKSKLVIILMLPKTRHEGAVIESVEQWGFMTTKTVEEVGIALDVIQKAGGVAGYVLGEPAFSVEKLNEIPLGMLQVIHALSPTRAAAMNGIEESTTKILALGLGALGSQIFNNLIRSGFGRWTLVDPDLMLPHNGARHFLGQWAVGHNKAEAMAEFANAVLDGPAIAESIPADFLDPKESGQQVATAYRAAELILDFSASVAVSRHLASGEVSTRAISAFLSPLGTSLVVAAEDPARECRLDWLEMLHYRAILNEPALKDSLQSPDARFRYGNSCRDVSTVLAQDDAAMWAGVASKAIKQIAKSAAAVLRIYHATPDGQVSLVSPEVAPLIGVVWRDWTIQFDVAVLHKTAELRRAKLPNETGGILLGNFDSHRRVCSIVEVVPSPLDSSEWPTSYIRGCAGLRRVVEDAEMRTLEQISYVGEWHSHPDGYGVRPSPDDYQAYGWLIGRMHVEGLPAVMLIIGENNNFCLVSDEPDR